MNTPYNTEYATAEEEQVGEVFRAPSAGQTSKIWNFLLLLLFYFNKGTHGQGSIRDHEKII